MMSRERWIKVLLGRLSVIVAVGSLLYPVSTLALTIAEEKKIGQEFHEKLKKAGVLVENRKAREYLSGLGQRLVEGIPKGPFDFNFHLVKSAAVNAFATPGGHVYVNTGLVNLAANEAQLASVLAHEIAHINARHIAQMIERSQKVNVAALAAMIAGAFLGGSGELSAAAIGFSLAGAATINLKYSRGQEEEADRLGLAYLVAAGYNSQAALDFLRSMRRYEFYSNSVPSYFLTHPGIENRIRYLDSLIQTRFPPTGRSQIGSDFRRVKTYALLERGDHQGNLRHFQGNLASDPADLDSLYGLAITQEIMGFFEQARENFQKALALAPGDADILKGLGMAFLNQGRHDEAIDLFRRSLRVEEKDKEALIGLGRAYLGKGDHQRALSALDRVAGIEGENTADYYYTRATVSGRLGDKGDSHYNFAKYFRMIKRVDSAAYHYQEAADHFPPDTERGREIRKELESLKAGDKPRPRERNLR